MATSVNNLAWKVGFRWSRGDASNPTGALGLDRTSRALHICEIDDHNTDWNVGADTHPSVYFHSATTPATDYIKVYHDATNGYIDVVGGNLMLAIAGTNEVTLTSTALSPATSDGNALGTTALMWADLFLASGAVINFDNGNVTLTHAAGFLTLGDNIGLRLGTTGDDILYHKTTTTNANTAVTSVTIGTPVSQALAADSLLISNITASGDIAIYVNNGGNSLEILMADASAGDLKLGHGVSGALRLNWGTQLTLLIGNVGLLQVDDAAISSFAGAADTAGKALYAETQDGGAASGNNNGVAGGLFSLKTGDGSAPAGTGTTGGNGGALSLETGAGAAGSATGTGGSGATLSLIAGAGGNVSGAGTAGNGGSVILTPGAAGTHSGGTAGKAGIVAARGALVDKTTQTALTDNATVTAAQLLTKVLDGTPTAAATYTLPTAALLVAQMPGVAVGDSFYFIVNNKAGGAYTITLAAGNGGTADGTLTVAQNVIRGFFVIITNVTGAAEAYFVYGLAA